MMQSMTGFGKAVKEIEGKRITVELRSLNSKSLDLNLRMPYDYKVKEHLVRKVISTNLTRGKVDASIFVELTEKNNTAIIDVALAKQYHAELSTLATALNEPKDENLLALVLKMPEVMSAKNQKEDVSDQEWKEVHATIEEAIEQFQTFRSDEGQTLAADFTTRINTIGALLEAIIKTDPTRIPKIKKRIKDNIAELVEKNSVDPNRLEQEMIFYIEKLDITEEKLRLQTHLDYFVSTMKEDNCGRKLGFIAQEIGREINTIGSKANDADIQQTVVQMKDELEKIKEQVLNVL